MQKRIAIGVVCLGVIVVAAHAFWSFRTSVQERLDYFDRELLVIRAEAHAEILTITADLETLAERIGVTGQELERAREQARELARQLKTEQETAAERLRRAIELKADSGSISVLEQQARQYQQDAATRIGGVSEEVQTVRMDLDATRNELAASVNQIGEVRMEVARNAAEVAELRHRGERDYFEFDIRRSRNPERIAGIRMQLQKTDTKRQKFDIRLFIDDRRLDEKGILVNVPMRFIVGRDRAPYELVVNQVDKDRIRGYVSTPKDSVLSVGDPALRTP